MAFSVNSLGGNPKMINLQKLQGLGYRMSPVGQASQASQASQATQATQATQA